MALLSNVTLSTATTATIVNDTLTNQNGRYKSHSWEFLVAVLATAISVSLIMALLAKCQVIRRYLASYRHTRLMDIDTVSQFDTSGQDMEFALQSGRAIHPHCLPPQTEEDDDGFIEDNYIPACERARAERAAENMEDTDDTEEEMEEMDEMDEIEFSIA